MHRLWRACQPYEGTRVNRCTHRPAIRNRRAGLFAVDELWLKWMLQRKIWVSSMTYRIAIYLSLSFHLTFPNCQHTFICAIRMRKYAYFAVCSWKFLLFIFTEVTNNGRPMNASLSEDSVADTAISKKNSDGKSFPQPHIYAKYHLKSWKSLFKLRNKGEKLYQIFTTTNDALRFFVFHSDRLIPFVQISSI